MLRDGVYSMRAGNINMKCRNKQNIPLTTAIPHEFNIFGIVAEATLPCIYETEKRYN